MTADSPRPVRLRKEGDERLAIDWSDNVTTVTRWSTLREQCPCAGCREERLKPPDPFRILKPSELTPLKPIRIEPIGIYAYKITWSDGHDSGIFTLEHLRSLGEAPQQ